MNKTTLQPVLFPELFSKPVHVVFSHEHLSSNGGAVLLAAQDRKLGLTEGLADCMLDKRQSGKVHHSLAEQLRQRITSIAVGCSDCNDAAKLRDDPVMKLSCGRDPVNGPALASQPTLSRFENSVSSTQLLRMGYWLAETVVRAQAKRRCGRNRPSRIIIDLDPTCDPTHGEQQLTFFNGFYDTWCYLPLVVTISFDNERRKYPVGVLLRPGNVCARAGALAILRRLIRLLRAHFPNTRLYCRADAGFASYDIFNYLDSEGVYYAIAMASNERLKDLSAGWMGVARCMADVSGQKVTIWRETTYRARRWHRPHRVVYKAEVVVEDGKSPRDNARFIVTNMPGYYEACAIFDFYYGHSDMENTIKELKNDLALDRTSCSRFGANQFRILLTVASYILMQSVQERSRDLDLRKATMATLRDRLLKISARVRCSARRIVLEFTTHHPWALQWLQCARSIGAVPT